jgi:histidinol phosphatase-like PHP family hydrolase
VVKWASTLGVPLTINTDAHAPSDLINMDFARRILLSAGVDEAKVDLVFQNARGLVERAIRR